MKSFPIHNHNKTMGALLNYFFGDSDIEIDGNDEYAGLILTVITLAL